jgi:sporulation protein YlmC with PRC-barrel domain
MIRFKRISETQDMKVFVENGDYFGEVEEAMVTMRKVAAWKIRATKSSILEKIFRTGASGGGKGVIVPHNLIKAIGDIMIISKSAIPAYPEDTN